MNFVELRQEFARRRKGSYTLEFSTWSEQKLSELNAFNAQLDYLFNARRGKCLSPECEQEIAEWVDYILNSAIPGVINETYGR